MLRLCLTKTLRQRDKTYKSVVCPLRSRLVLNFALQFTGRQGDQHQAQDNSNGSEEQIAPQSRVKACIARLNQQAESAGSPLHRLYHPKKSFLHKYFWENDKLEDGIAQVSSESSESQFQFGSPISANEQQDIIAESTNHEEANAAVKPLQNGNSGHRHLAEQPLDLKVQHRSFNSAFLTAKLKAQAMALDSAPPLPSSFSPKSQDSAVWPSAYPARLRPVPLNTKRSQKAAQGPSQPMSPQTPAQSDQAHLVHGPSQCLHSQTESQSPLPAPASHEQAFHHPHQLCNGTSAPSASEPGLADQSRRESPRENDENPDTSAQVRQDFPVCHAKEVQQVSGLQCHELQVNGQHSSHPAHMLDQIASPFATFQNARWPSSNPSDLGEANGQIGQQQQLNTAQPWEETTHMNDNHVAVKTTNGDLQSFAGSNHTGSAALWSTKSSRIKENHGAKSGPNGSTLETSKCSPVLSACNTDPRSTKE